MKKSTTSNKSELDQIVKELRKKVLQEEKEKQE